MCTWRAADARRRAGVYLRVEVRRAADVDAVVRVSSRAGRAHRRVIDEQTPSSGGEDGARAKSRGLGEGQRRGDEGDD